MQYVYCIQRCIMKKVASLLLLAAIAGGAAAQTKKLAITPALSANINHVLGTNTVQVLIPGVETIELELTQSTNNTFTIKTADYNFDGNKDFAFAGRDPLNPAAPSVYDIYLYNPQDKTFEAPENPGGACGQFSNVRLNAADKTLRSSCKSGSKMSVDIFKWVTPFSLELTKSTDNSAEAQGEAAEEKAEQKTEKADTKKEAREEHNELRKGKRDARKDAREEKDDDE